MRRTFESAQGWVESGTKLFLDAADLADMGLDAPSGLPGWTRKHLVAHVAANAQALGNLVQWAATGRPTPMYASTEQRADDIAAGGLRPAAELTAWLRSSADALAAAMAGLSSQNWQAEVVTAQGRTVPASEVAWLRAREVCVHAVDLANGVTFADLPEPFLSALCDDVVAKRSASSALSLESTDTPGLWNLSGVSSTVVAPLEALAAYLTGRPNTLTKADAAGAPALSAWL